MGGFDRTGRGFALRAFHMELVLVRRGRAALFPIPLALCIARTSTNSTTSFLDFLRFCIRNLWQTLRGPTVSHSITIEPVTNSFSSCLAVRSFFTKLNLKRTWVLPSLQTAGGPTPGRARITTEAERKGELMSERSNQFHHPQAHLSKDHS